MDKVVRLTRRSILEGEFESFMKIGFRLEGVLQQGGVESRLLSENKRVRTKIHRRARAPRRVPLCDRPQGFAGLILLLPLVPVPFDGNLQMIG